MKKEIIKFLGQKVIAFFIMLFFAFLINSFLRVEAAYCEPTGCNHKEQDEACIARCDYSKLENHQEVNGFCDGYYNNDVPPVVKFRCIEVGGGGGGGGGGGRRRRRRRRWRWGGVQTGLNVKCNCNNKIYNACGNYYGLTNIKYRGPCTPTLTGPDTCNAKAINRYYQYQSCAVAPTSTPIPPTATPPLSCLKSQGDANCIGGIDLADFEIWRKEFTGELDTKTADFNKDTKISLADFEIWRSSYYK